MHDRSRDTYDLDELLHPARAFEHPVDVVNDADLTLNEKRAILARWASDACAVESAPTLRTNPRGVMVHFDEIMDALRALDRQTGLADHGRRATRRQTRSSRDPNGDDGQHNVLH